MAPDKIIDQLELLEVHYLSVDGAIHRGQILCNRKISADIRDLFTFMLNEGFVIEKAIPVVRYNWVTAYRWQTQQLQFCYRNITYSKHAHGMAIDINPRFNPLRWKREIVPTNLWGTLRHHHQRHTLP